MRLSVLDLGSNSFHVLVADVDDGGTVVPVAREREMLHLGSEVARHGAIPTQVADQAVAVVAHLTELAKRLGSQRRLAFATSALRDADNGPEVVAEMERAADTTIRVIDGNEEAALSVRGVAASLGSAQQPRLVLDLGGGSLELAIGLGDEVVACASLPLGVSRLSNLIEHDPPRKKDVAHLVEVVRTELEPVVDRLDMTEVSQVIAVGGTVRALARVVAAGENLWLPATLNLMTMTRRQLRQLRDTLVKLDTSQRADLPGMKTKRADRIHIAAVVMTTTLVQLGIKQLQVSDWGLREGALLACVGASAPPLDELRRREVSRMQTTFVPDDPHMDHVAMLAAQLFDATTDLHGLSEGDRDLLIAGARLHGVGQALALRRQHHHGAYLIEHFELRGFSPVETAMLCCMARFHRSRGMSRSYLPWSSMTEVDARRTAEMVAILQVADGLDRARDQAVTAVEVSNHDGAIELVVAGDQLHVALAEVQRRTAWFEEVFGVAVVIRTNGDRATPDIAR